MNTIPMDVNNSSGLSRSEAASAFLESWKDPKEVSKDDEGAKPEHDETVEEGETQEDADTQSTEETNEDPNASEDSDGDTESTESKTPKKAANDDDEITYSVDGEERKVSVKDLKRLAGQEASLTRKSQEVAAERKVVDDTKNLHFNALNTLVQRAEARYKPFADMDMLVASKELSSEDLFAVRSEANAAYQDLAYLTQELGQYTEKARTEQQQNTAQAAAECIKVLSDEKTGIPGWSEKLYDDLRSYAKTSGMSANVVDNITDPMALKIIHKAMAYDKIKQVATTKKVGSAKNTIKSTTNVSTVKSSTDGSVKTAMAKLRATGSRQNAADAFMAKWVVAD